jgi:hypothetical protein
VPCNGLKYNNICEVIDVCSITCFLYLKEGTDFVDENVIMLSEVMEK